MDNPNIGDDSLTNLTKLFTRFSWDKKLSDLTEEEILYVEGGWGWLSGLVGSFGKWLLSSGLFDGLLS